MLIYSSIDWSEEVTSPVRVLAIVHIDREEIAHLDNELGRVRVLIRRPDDEPFKHTDAKPHMRREFFPAIGRIPSLRAHVLVCEKTFKNVRFGASRLPKGMFIRGTGS